MHQQRSPPSLLSIDERKQSHSHLTTPHVTPPHNRPHHVDFAPEPHYREDATLSPVSPRRITYVRVGPTPAASPPQTPPPERSSSGSIGSAINNSFALQALKTPTIMHMHLKEGAMTPQEAVPSYEQLLEMIIRICSQRMIKQAAPPAPPTQPGEPALQENPLSTSTSSAAAPAAAPQQLLSADAHLFEAGGTSDDVVLIVSQLRAELNYDDLSAVDVFHHPTPAQLAKLLHTRMSDEAAEELDWDEYEEEIEEEEEEDEEENIGGGGGSGREEDQEISRSVDLNDSGDERRLRHQANSGLAIVVVGEEKEHPQHRYPNSSISAAPSPSATPNPHRHSSPTHEHDELEPTGTPTLDTILKSTLKLPSHLKQRRNSRLLGNAAGHHAKRDSFHVKRGSISKRGDSMLTSGQHKKNKHSASNNISPALIAQAQAQGNQRSRDSLNLPAGFLTLPSSIANRRSSLDATRRVSINAGSGGLLGPGMVSASRRPSIRPSSLGGPILRPRPTPPPAGGSIAALANQQKEKSKLKGQKKWKLTKRVPNPELKVELQDESLLPFSKRERWYWKFVQLFYMILMWTTFSSALAVGWKVSNFLSTDPADYLDSIYLGLMVRTSVFALCTATVLLIMLPTWKIFWDLVCGGALRENETEDLGFRQKSREWFLGVYWDVMSTIVTPLIGTGIYNVLLTILGANIGSGTIIYTTSFDLIGLHLVNIGDDVIVTHNVSLSSVNVDRRAGTIQGQMTIIGSLTIIEEQAVIDSGTIIGRRSYIESVSVVSGVIPPCTYWKNRAGMKDVKLDAADKAASDAAIMKTPPRRSIIQHLFQLTMLMFFGLASLQSAVFFQWIYYNSTTIETVIKEGGANYERRPETWFFHDELPKIRYALFPAWIMIWAAWSCVSVIIMYRAVSFIAKVICPLKLMIRSEDMLNDDEHLLEQEEEHADVSSHTSNTEFGSAPSSPSHQGLNDVLHVGSSSNVNSIIKRNSKSNKKKKNSTSSSSSSRPKLGACQIPIHSWQFLLHSWLPSVLNDLHPYNRAILAVCHATHHWLRACGANIATDSLFIGPITVIRQPYHLLQVDKDAMCMNSVALGCWRFTTNLATESRSITFGDIHLSEGAFLANCCLIYPQVNIPPFATVSTMSVVIPEVLDVKKDDVATKPGGPNAATAAADKARATRLQEATNEKNGLRKLFIGVPASVSYYRPDATSTLSSAVVPPKAVENKPYAVSDSSSVVPVASSSTAASTVDQNTEYRFPQLVIHLFGLFIIVFWSAVWGCCFLPGLFLLDYIQNLEWFESSATILVLLVPVAYMIIVPLMLLANLLFKWLWLGTYHADAQHHFRSWYFMRYTLTHLGGDRSPVLMSFIAPYLSGTEWLIYYLRALGMKIGENVYVGAFDAFGDYDLHDIEDWTFIAGSSDAFAHTVMAGKMRWGKLKYEQGTTLAGRSHVMPGTTIGARAKIEPNTVVTKGDVIPAGVRWAGAPGKKIGRVKHTTQLLQRQQPTPKHASEEKTIDQNVHAIQITSVPSSPVSPNGRRLAVTGQDPKSAHPVFQYPNRNDAASLEIGDHARAFVKRFLNPIYPNGITYEKNHYQYDYTPLLNRNVVRASAGSIGGGVGGGGEKSRIGAGGEKSRIGRPTPGPSGGRISDPVPTASGTPAPAGIMTVRPFASSSQSVNGHMSRNADLLALNERHASGSQLLPVDDLVMPLSAVPTSGLKAPTPMLRGAMLNVPGSSAGTGTNTPHGRRSRRPSKQRRPTVCVVGAGASGLTAALELHLAGVDVTVLEKATKVGGKASSFNVDNTAYDLGAHTMSSSFATVEHYSTLLKVPRGLSVDSEVVVYPSDSGKRKKGEDLHTANTRVIQSPQRKQAMTRIITLLKLVFDECTSLGIDLLTPSIGDLPQLKNGITIISPHTPPPLIFYEALSCDYPLRIREQLSSNTNAKKLLAWLTEIAKLMPQSDLECVFAGCGYGFTTLQRGTSKSNLLSSTSSPSSPANEPHAPWVLPSFYFLRGMYFLGIHKTTVPPTSSSSDSSNSPPPHRSHHSHSPSVAPIIPWRFEHGTSALWDSMCDQLNSGGYGKQRVFVGIDIQSISRSEQGVIVTYRDPHIENRPVIRQFDSIVFSVSPAVTSPFLDLTQYERTLFDRIRHLPVVSIVARLKAKPGHVGIGKSGMFLPIEGASSGITSIGKVIAIQHRGGEGEVYTVTMYRPLPSTTNSASTSAPTPASAAAIAQLHEAMKSDIDMLGCSVTDILHTADFSDYMPHVSSSSLAQGFYKSFASLQGQRRTYWTGALMSFECLEAVMEFSRRLVTKKILPELTQLASSSSSTFAMMPVPPPRRTISRHGRNSRSVSGRVSRTDLGGLNLGLINGMGGSSPNTRKPSPAHSRAHSRHASQQIRQQIGPSSPPSPSPQSPQTNTNYSPVPPTGTNNSPVSPQNNNSNSSPSPLAPIPVHTHAPLLSYPSSSQTPPPISAAQIQHDLLTSLEASQLGEHASGPWNMEPDPLTGIYPSIMNIIYHHVKTQPHMHCMSWVNEKGVDEMTLTYSQFWAAALKVAHQIRQKLSKMKAADSIGTVTQFPPEVDPAPLQAERPRVLLCYTFDLNFITGFIGCLLADVIAVPIYPPDPSSIKRSLTKLNAIRESCDARIALTNTTFNRYRIVSSMTQLGGASTKEGKTMQWPKDLEWIVTDAAPQVISKWKQPADWKFETTPGYKTAHPAKILFLQYTSGSTGLPKGVCIGHRNVLHNVYGIYSDAILLHKGERMIFSGWLPPFHDFGLIAQHFTQLVSGGSGYFMSPLTFISRPMIWPQTLSRVRCTMTGSPNFGLELVTRKYQAPDPAKGQPPIDLSCVKNMMMGAEPCRISTITAFLNVFAEKHAFSPTACAMGYGLAEHVFVATHQFPPPQVVIDRKYLTSPLHPTVLSMGSHWQVNNVDLRIVNADTSIECEEGGIGEIWMSSPSKAAAYWNISEVSSATFHSKLKFAEDVDALKPATNASSPRTANHGDIQLVSISSRHGASDSDAVALLNAAASSSSSYSPRPRVSAAVADRHFLRTGDEGYILRGELYLTGRIKDLIIVRGEKYYPHDIEATVMDSHPHIRPGNTAAFAETAVGADGLPSVEQLIVVSELRAPMNSPAEYAALSSVVMASVRSSHGVAVSRLVLLPPKTIAKTSSGKIARSESRQRLKQGSYKILYEAKE